VSESVALGTTLDLLPLRSAAGQPRGCHRGITQRSSGSSWRWHNVFSQKLGCRGAAAHRCFRTGRPPGRSPRQSPGETHALLGAVGVPASPLQKTSATGRTLAAALLTLSRCRRGGGLGLGARSARAREPWSWRRRAQWAQTRCSLFKGRTGLLKISLPSLSSFAVVGKRETFGRCHTAVLEQLQNLGARSARAREPWRRW